MFSNSASCLALRLLWAAVCVSLVGCGKEERAVVGFFGALSGPAADMGVEGHNGALLAIEACNASGGLEGRLVTIRAFDIAQDPQRAREVLMELQRSETLGVIGPFTSEMAVAMLPAIVAGTTTVVSPTASSPLLSGRNDPLLRVYPNNTQLATKLASYLSESDGVRRVSLVCDARNRAYTDSYGNALEDRLRELGGAVLTEVHFGLTRPINFDALVDEALAPEPEAVVILANALDSALLCQQLKKRGEEVPVYGSEWSSSSQIIEYGGSTVNGFTYVEVVARKHASEAYRDFVRRYRARFGYEPGFSAILGYEATGILLEASAAVGPGEVREWILARGTFPTLQGTLSFDRFGDCERSAFIGRVENGEIVTVGEIE